MSDIIRRLENLIRIGTVASVDHAAARCIVDCGGIVTAPLPWLTLRAGTDRTWDAPTAGEQVVVLAPGGEMMQAVVIMGLYQTQAPAPAAQAHIKTRHFEDGATITYDTAAHALTAILPSGGTAVITANGGTTINASGGITINASGGATINGNTKINGNLNISGSLAGGTGGGGGATINGTIKATGDIVAGSISVQNHKHIEQGDGKPTSAAIA
ncbi:MULTISPECIES: phage baseplate assembly protein V [Moraxella]|uniref:Phage baseplate assembly protein V n=1 Tax=Moraxella catarrhalis TaxID=480 RepID=A0A7Z1A3H5_MORCA|nr:phage baseplate assembly protein V [Moraxella catarrhalis]OAV00226.1 Phage baseplate assembly protein V [Moraxella catarrhalis]STY82495.1 Phage P2 baseplate assembly protein gpV [Moraxella catarrhalis]